MKKLVLIAVTPLMAGFLWAQSAARTETTTTTTTTKSATYEGTLIDAGCRTTHAEHHESTSTDANGATQTRTSDSSVSECPVTSSTTSYGLVTSDGRYVRLDPTGNSKIVTIVKEKPGKEVRVVGTAKGDVVVLDSIQ
jgi:hypothetical protein